MSQNRFAKLIKVCIFVLVVIVCDYLVTSFDNEVKVSFY